MKKTGIFIYPKGTKKPLSFSLLQLKYGNVHVIECNANEVQRMLEDMEQTYTVAKCDFYVKGFVTKNLYSFYKKRKGTGQVRLYFNRNQTFVMLGDQKSA